MFSLAHSTRVGGAFGLSVEQAAWVIDPLNGRDSASGMPGDPLADFAGFKYLTRGQVISQNTTIDVLGNTDENVSLCPEFANNALLKIRSTPTSVLSGTLTAGTLEWSNAGHQEVNLVCSGLPTSWTASDLIGRMIRNTSVARAGNTTWAYKDLGTKKARAPGWTAPFYYNDSGVSGDTFEALSIAQCTGAWLIEGRGHGFVWIEDIELGARGGSHSVEIRSAATATRSRLNSLDVVVGGGLYAIGCYIGDGCRPMNGGSLTLELSVAVRSVSTAIEARQGGNLYLYEQNIADGYGVTVGIGSTCTVDASGSLSCCNCTIGLACVNGGAVDQAGYLWCRDCTTQVLQIYPGVVYGYASGRAPLNVGSTSPSLGTVGVTTIDALPKSAANNSAHVVVRI